MVLVEGLAAAGRVSHRSPQARGGRDLAAVGLGGKHDAARDLLAVHQDGACAAHALPAAVFGIGHVGHLAQPAQQAEVPVG